MPKAQRGGSQDGLLSDLYQIESGDSDEVRVSNPVATPNVTGIPTARKGFRGTSTRRGGSDAMAKRVGVWDYGVASKANNVASSDDHEQHLHCAQSDTRVSGQALCRLCYFQWRAKIDRELNY